MMNTHSSWLSGMKTLSLIILLFNIKNHVVSSEELTNNDNDNQLFQETNEVWKSQPSMYNKNFGMTDYDQLQKFAPMISNYDYADLMQNVDYDASKLNAFNQISDSDESAEVKKRFWKPFTWKRGPGATNTNWGNLRSTGWGKRQPGNWNNLRGLWGKRSSWGRLQGGWGKK